MGRPSSYKPEYCKKVVEYLAEGHSIAAFAGHIGVARSVVFEWMKHHPDFAEAYQIAKGKSLAFWEGKLISAASGNSKAAPAVLIFGVKNRGSEDWRDVQSLEHTGKDGKPIETKDTSARERLSDLVTRISERGRESENNRKPH